MVRVRRVLAAYPATSYAGDGGTGFRMNGARIEIQYCPVTIDAMYQKHLTIYRKSIPLPG